MPLTWNNYGQHTSGTMGGQTVDGDLSHTNPYRSGVAGFSGMVFGHPTGYHTSSPKVMLCIAMHITSLAAFSTA